MRCFYHHDPNHPHEHMPPGSRFHGHGHSHGGGDPHGSDAEQAAFFDRLADGEDMTSFAPEEEARMERMFAAWDIGEGQRILEAGCGKGRLTERLARAVGTAGRVWACDLSAGMLGVAAARLSGAGLLGRVELYHGSVMRMPLPAGTFDRVILFSVFPHFSDKAAVLALSALALRAGGALWVGHLNSRDEMNSFHRGVGDAVEAHELPDEAAMRRLVEGAGLEWVGLTDESGYYALEARKR